MIAYLRGEVLEKGKDWLIVRTGDVGYLVSVPAPVLARYAKGEEARLFTHLIVRDDAQELVGFPTMPELEFYWKLTSVSGVGPKMALHLLALGPVASIRKAVERGDVAFLESAHGVGRKSAQRVILELKGKLVGDDDPETGTSDEVVSALENLGYPRAKAREIVAALPADATTEERIRLALRQLTH